ncbi:VOC family protein [Falsiroseomonas selenitidurans]|uniref:VOC family protein n=1 Tax=Falsiroseomonas selenitidurans TaxID=2716335 RepID=A0ABX1DYU3_9PROT|nr:VOC family protein [Falsiroseomonas selenitidurans]NKC30041.1 VOC family protein [Falsiroseomonas selenitidurans]
MSPYRFDHIHLRSPDPEATAAFYVSAFGAAITGRATPGGRLRVMLDLAAVPLFVEQVPAETHAPPAPPFLGIEHVGLAVDDLDAALADLQGKGVPLISGPTEARPGVRIAFLQAPDGVRVELIERRG